jgi:hypothetical protein
MRVLTQVEAVTLPVGTVVFINDRGSPRISPAVSEIMEGDAAIVYAAMASHDAHYPVTPYRHPFPRIPNWSEYQLRHNKHEVILPDQELGRLIVGFIKLGPDEIDIAEIIEQWKQEQAHEA